MKAKHQRLVLISIAFVALLAAVLIAVYALRDQASYFYTPGDIAEQSVEPGRAIRLGGMVRKGSIKTQADGVTIDFVVEDNRGSIPVRYTGITPDLFVEGSGVVAEGRIDNQGRFIADTLLAKHDENYVPREMQDITTAQAEHSGDTVVK